MDNSNSPLLDVFAVVYQDILDRLYISDVVEYAKKLGEVKADGFRVFRNNNGEHKVVVK